MNPLALTFRANPGCRYILGEGAEVPCCGAPRRPGSSYCAMHHALCYIPSRGDAYRAKLREIYAVARYGPQLITSISPSDADLDALDRAQAQAAR